jgi:sec-independent protein translocase protein TatA
MHISALLFLSNLFSSDMIIIVFVALLLFGGEKLPEIARGLGRGIRDFKDASEGIKREINEHINSLEEKKAETSLNNQAAAAQNQLPENTSHLNESHPSVENTMPVNENYFAGSENTVTEEHPVAHNGPGGEEHAAGSHSDSGTATTETNKNS